jgi:hypothetical protein
MSRYQQDQRSKEMPRMSLSMLMYGMMACALAALLAVLVVEALGSRVNVALRPRLAAPVSRRRRRGRVRNDQECPQRVAGASLATRGVSPSRRRATPSSCRRWLA